MKSIIGKRYGSRVVLAKGPSAVRSDGRISYARYRVRCTCGKESVISGQGLRHHGYLCQKPKQTHCVRGHLRTPENLSGKNCKLCMKQWGIEHPDERRRISREYSRRYRMETLYHLTEEQYTAMYSAQKGLCALPSCGEPIDAIDHSHEKERTRGLMCRKHNSGIGFFSHNPQLLREAAEYLEKFS